MRAGVVVLSEPVIDDDLSLLGRREPFGIEYLTAQRAVEPLVVPVLPRRSRVDADRLWARVGCICRCLPLFCARLRSGALVPHSVSLERNIPAQEEQVDQVGQNQEDN